MKARPVAYYLRLRLLQAWRFFPANDIHPLVGTLLAAAILAALVVALFVRTQWAPWIVAAIPVSLFLSLRNPAAARELRLLLSAKQRLLYRLAEALLLSLPFLCALLLLAAWKPAALLLALSFFAAIPEKSFRFQLPALPSPFPSPAVEWHHAWRRFFAVFIVYAALLCVSAFVGNGAIAIVGFIAALGSVCACYGELEAVEMLCVYRASPGKFLRQKLRLASVGYMLLLAPLVLVVMLFARDAFLFLPVAGVVGMLWLYGSVLLKYLFYPNAFAVQFSQALLFLSAVAALAAPALIILLALVGVYAFVRSRSRLRTFLPC